MGKLWIVQIKTTSKESAEIIKRDIENGYTRKHPNYQCDEVFEQEI